MSLQADKVMHDVTLYDQLSTLRHLMHYRSVSTPVATVCV